MPTSDLERCRAALLLWMRWNDAQERITQSLFEAGGDQAKVEQLMDQLDELRQKAVEASRAILDAPDVEPPSES